MNRNYYIHLITRWLVIPLLLVAAIQPKVPAILYCPITCTCVMDDVVEDNRATCSFGNSTADLSWYMGGDHLTLELVCTEAVENFQYDCNDWPHFNISANNRRTRLIVTGCSPSVMRCVNGMLISVTNFSIVNTTMMTETYNSKDLNEFDNVQQVKLTLRDEDTNIPATAVNSLSALKGLTVYGGNLSLSSNEFNHSSLRILGLLNNSIHSFASDTFNGLPNLKYLSIQSNKFEHLDANTFRGLDGVTTLEILRNPLITIDPNALSPMEQLTSLSLEYNNLKTIPNGLFISNKHLSWIYIRYNQNEITLDTHAFANLPKSVEKLYISHNKVKHLPENVFDGSTNIRQLFLDHNNIEYLPPKLFATITNLTTVVLSVNKIRYISDQLFSENKKLTIVLLYSNYIKVLSGKIFTHSPNLEIVDLSNNKLFHIERDIFNGTSLKKLHLAYNNLQRIVGNSTLHWQTKELDLRGNNMTVFEDWFVEIVGLENLQLSANKIKLFKENYIYRLNSVIKIHLYENSITEIVRDTSDPPLNVTPRNVTLYLSNNPLQCDCVVTTLLKDWHKYGILTDYENITCDNEEKLSNLNAYVQCNKTHALVALVGSSAVGALVIAVLLLTIFTRRRKIWTNVRNLLESNSSSYIFKKDILNETNEMKEEAKLYDLFISFAHQDADLVVDQLLPVLENDWKFKVCVHYRDWVVGDLIPVQIKESVDNSTMTMIILTKHFLKSEWSNLEFRTAHELGIEDGTPRVILVLINDSVTKHDKLCGDLKAYIDMNTYLVWNDTFFWDKLQKILPKSQKIKSLK